MAKKVCEECYYGSNCGPNTIACHRYPPTITKAEGNEVTTYFPVLNAASWCGEWKPQVPWAKAKRMVRTGAK